MSVILYHPGLCRLVVRMVADVLHENVRGRVHRPEGESQVGAHAWLGKWHTRSPLESSYEHTQHQGMRFYNFIFLKRSWASDRLHLAASLSWLGQRAEREDSPLTFILYPEGTLVSKDTRPLSKKYADKIGIVRAPPGKSYLH